ncbi:phage antirepressor [Actinotignum urinale]|uniref:Phage antirepressor KilAC domain-containing protein n=1 Tax=Actinotignum urinale TaxID=190146 RepID=A0ABU5G885_9ACTO|nr:phage antirepressor KilAC domain-containing protein [Actinotignum urinale]MDY5132266.1 phage antirepressor KilAC domain-containing protein [Actinotignum urinale]
MSKIIPFTFNNTELRTLNIDGEPWFVASDIAKILGYRDANRLTRRLDDDEKGTRSVGTLGGTQEMAVINEPGLYTAILGSKLETVKDFKRWVTHEVIPSIRKHGGYMAGQNIMSPEQMALKSMQWLQSVVEEQTKQLEQQKPKVLFADSVNASHTTILIGELAKILKGNGIDTGANRLFAWMRDNGYLIKRRGSDWNMPTQTAMDKGLFHIKETAITHSDGHVTISKTTKVTGKGQQYFINKFMNTPPIPA